MHTENEFEIKKFKDLSQDWNKKDGSFAMLHKMNNLRTQYITQNAQVKKSKILDIGCGGGLLSEALSSIGGVVTAIDPCFENIEAAKKYSKEDIEYLNTSIEEFSKLGMCFDIICIMEVVEHVENLDYFLKLCAKMLKVGGNFFFSTINRSLRSYLFGIVAAEYILKLLPKKTHSWQKFVKPSEIFHHLQENKIMVKNLSGMKYNVFLDKWNIQQNLDVNYIGFGVKY